MTHGIVRSCLFHGDVDVIKAASEARFPLVGGRSEIAVPLRDGEYSNAVITTRRMAREVDFRL
jgi:hypothetical protein